MSVGSSALNVSSDPQTSLAHCNTIARAFWSAMSRKRGGMHEARHAVRLRHRRRSKGLQCPAGSHQTQLEGAAGVGERKGASAKPRGETQSAFCSLRLEQRSSCATGGESARLCRASWRCACEFVFGTGCAYDLNFLCAGTPIVYCLPSFSLACEPPQLTPVKISCSETDCNASEFLLLPLRWEVGRRLRYEILRPESMAQRLRAYTAALRDSELELPCPLEATARAYTPHFLGASDLAR